MKKNLTLSNKFKLTWAHCNPNAKIPTLSTSNRIPIIVFTIEKMFGKNETCYTNGIKVDLNLLY